MQPRDLSEHIAYVPGRGPEEVARERGVDAATLVTLSSNENALGPSPAAVEALKQAASEVNRYPKAAFVELIDALAKQWEVSPAQVWLANGGDGAIDYLSRAMLKPNDVILVPEPGFAYYAMSARFHHGKSRTYPIEQADDFALTEERVLSSYAGERMIYITSPHNPTGSTMTPAAIETIAEETDPNTLIVVDEAYGEFSSTASAIGLVRERDDVAVLRSFSKAYGLAGVRLGYTIVPNAWAESFERVNTPFAASELACRAGIAALDDTDHLERTIEMVTRGRSYLQTHLEASTWASEGNFVLAKVGDADAVADAMLDRGVIVRSCTSFGLPGCIRITVGRRVELDAAIAACNGVLEAQNEGMNP